MTRDVQQFIDALATAAHAIEFSPEMSWRQVLFERCGQGWALADPHHSDRAMLAAFAQEYVRADVHQATLAPRLHVAWLEEVLAIPRLPVVPDTVVASVTVDPALAPAVMPMATLLRGGKDAYGSERRYATLDALTAHGAAVVGVRALVPGGPTPGSPGAMLAAPAFPISFPSSATAAASAPPAPHVLRIHSSVLAFPGGTMSVRLAFTSAAGVAALRKSGMWRHMCADGTLSEPIAGSGSGDAITLTLRDGCIDPDGGIPWLECTVTPGQPVPEGLRFDDVTVAVTSRAGVVPQAAFANAGAMDVSTEFEPFHANAACGDAFYLRSDEALAKHLSFLEVSVTPFSPLAGGARKVVMTTVQGPHLAAAVGEMWLQDSGSLSVPVLQEYVDMSGSELQEYVDMSGSELQKYGDMSGSELQEHSRRLAARGVFFDAASGPREASIGAAEPLAKADRSSEAVIVSSYSEITRADASIQWQRRVGGAWVGFGRTMTSLSTGTAESTEGEPGSERFPVSGEDGHYVRAFITSGDLGWRAYQEGIANFATRAVTHPNSPGVMPMPLVPAKFTEPRIAYGTHPVRADAVEAWSGWRHQTHGTGRFTPFRRAVDDDLNRVMVAVGLDVGDGATGSTVSLYVVLDSAASCGTDAPVEDDDSVTQWQWWDGAYWQPLGIADGTHRLRESGLLRFVAPDGWADGCEELTAKTGRWIRFVSKSPERIGAIHDVIPDAVVAVYSSSAPDPETDSTPASPLEPGTIKGTVTPVRGVKKVTNLASSPGRGPEDSPAYAARASGLTRHRGRSLSPWDYEALVSNEFPEIAALRCLPHTDADGHAPGSVGLVVVPKNPAETQPLPSFSLTGRIVDALRPLMPVHARLTVVCPLYVPVSVTASVRLRHGVAALSGRAAVAVALEAFLHPGTTAGERWGEVLYASTLVSVLGRVPEVDAVQDFTMHGPDGKPTQAVEVDSCRGLYCSTGRHDLDVEEQP